MTRWLLIGFLAGFAAVRDQQLAESRRKEQAAQAARRQWQETAKILERQRNHFSNKLSDVASARFEEKMEILDVLREAGVEDFRGEPTMLGGVKALVAERDEAIEAARPSAPCGATNTSFDTNRIFTCELPVGHRGDHQKGSTMWRERIL